MSPTAVSAPGKVLLAGGYLVLDRAYTGLVFGLSARIHVLVHDIDTSSGVQLSEIVVQSPQFLEARWNYGYHLTGEEGGVSVIQLQGNHTETLSPNPFVEKTLLYALTYISTLLPPTTTLKPTKITILADNDYYSHSSSPAPPNKTSHYFTSFNVRLPDAHKTGLGSSAALVTSLTAALLTHYLPSFSLTSNSSTSRSTLHNLAQAAHCAAQGKVGSGFDVAAAVYGTCVYRRFSPSLLSTIPEPGTPGFARAVKDVVEGEWDTEVSKGGVTIPDGMALVMCDVDCGSQTVGMVKRVLEWRKNDSEGAKKLWDDLQERNVKLGETLARGEVQGLKGAFGAIRELIREMGDSSGVQIEPREQTELLDAAMEVEGVEGGVVPGAGGYDAVVLLVRDDGVTMGGLKVFLERWSGEREGKVKLLDAKGELEGAKVEDVAAYGEFA